ncbi:MAG: hypothetical protein WDL87_06160 [Candidatus Omnitrophota bacterium]|jgi:Tfp pilus assembly protein PilX
MVKLKRNNKRGVVIFIVLITLLIVAALSQVVLNIILNQSRLNYHQVSRLQAYYAVLAAMNLTRENLRLQNWTTNTYTLCSSGCTVNDPDIPYRVTITVGAPNANGIRQILLHTDYTYP